MVSNATGLSASKHVPLWELLWFSIVANISIAAMNFSLMLNSVGFYQVIFLDLALLLFDLKIVVLIPFSFDSFDLDFEIEHDSSGMRVGMDST